MIENSETEDKKKKIWKESVWREGRSNTGMCRGRGGEESRKAVVEVIKRE